MNSPSTGGPLKKKSEEKSVKETTSIYRGVSYNSHSKKWKAVITVGRKQYFLGYFPLEDKAARAYDQAALQLKGEKASTNFKYDAVTIAHMIKNPTEMNQPKEQGDAVMKDDGSTGDEEYAGGGDVAMMSEPKCATLERLLDAPTNESMESVRDVEIEISAVKAALLNAHRANNSRKTKDDVPNEFMCL